MNSFVQRTTVRRSHFRRARLRVALVACCLSVSCVCAGCLPRNSGPSQVAQGRYYAAGNSEYDDFFVALHRWQVELAKAPDDLLSVRRALAAAVASDSDASDAELAEKTKARLERAAEHGSPLRVEFEIPAPPDPEKTAASLLASGKPSDEDREPIEKLQSALTGVLRFSAEMKLALKQIEELQGQSPKLQSQVETVFGGAGAIKRGEVTQNLRDADRVMVLMLARAQETERSADTLIDGLKRALNPGSKAANGSSPTEPSNDKPADSARESRPTETRRPPARKPTESAGKPPATHSGKSADFEP